MSETPKDPENAPPTLEYQGPNPQKENALRPIREGTRGGIGAVVSLFSTLCLSVYAAVGRRAYREPSFLNPIIAAVIVYGILGLIAFYLYRRHRSIAFAQGALLGIGFGLLLDGLCYLTTKL